MSDKMSSRDKLGDDTTPDTHRQIPILPPSRPQPRQCTRCHTASSPRDEHDSFSSDLSESRLQGKGRSLKSNHRLPLSSLSPSSLGTSSPSPWLGAGGVGHARPDTTLAEPMNPGKTVWGNPGEKRGKDTDGVRRHAMHGDEAQPRVLGRRPLGRTQTKDPAARWYRTCCVIMLRCMAKIK
jgi:hypothetical protein